MLAKCDRDESCTGKVTPISSKGPKFLAQTDFCVHRLRICDKRNLAKISKSFKVKAENQCEKHKDYSLRSLYVFYIM